MGLSWPPILYLTRLLEHLKFKKEKLRVVSKQCASITFEVRETDGTLKKKLRHWQIFRRHSPLSPPSLLLLPFASSRLSGKREKFSKRISWPDSHFSPSITSFNNSPLNCINCDYISNFVPFCRMRLVRPLLGLVLGLSTVSSRILEDGELIVDNSILEVEMPRFRGHPWDHVVRFFVFFLVSAWTYLIFVTDTTDMSV